MWGRYKKLKALGVLSINQRNADYVLPFNKRKHYPLVDDKLKSKELAIDAAIAVPPLYLTIRTENQIKHIDELLKPYKDFVIKPARGAGGDGIIVVTDRVFGRYRQINGKLLSTNEISYHLSCLLSGAYSLGGHPDYAIIEHRVVVSSVFAEVTYEGIPDIRVITFRGYPAMAMLRLPTRSSGGKANLHQGAIGVGISIGEGKTTYGVFHNEIIDFHPDTLKPINALQIPYWDDILLLAAKSYDLTGLGYLGVDIVLDKEHGPLMLEFNARPGLNIQIANQDGLRHRYQTIQARAELGFEDAASRVEFSKLSFK